MSCSGKVILLCLPYIHMASKSTKEDDKRKNHSKTPNYTSRILVKVVWSVPSAWVKKFRTLRSHCGLFRTIENFIGRNRCRGLKPEAMIGKFHSATKVKYGQICSLNRSTYFCHQNARIRLYISLPMSRRTQSWWSRWRGDYGCHGQALRHYGWAWLQQGLTAKILLQELSNLQFQLKVIFS